MGLLGAAVSALCGAERRVEVAARNVANAHTPGYKREVVFAEIADAAEAAGRGRFYPETISMKVLAQGALSESGGSLDFAIEGEGVLLVREGNRLFATRGGEFAMAADGTVVDAQGRRLQQAGGGDLVLERGEIVVHEDGTAMVDGIPAGAVGLYPGGLAATDQNRGLAPSDIGVPAKGDQGKLRQGMLERSNVTLSDEMVSLMQTQRMGEAAAQIVRTYDQLVGQAVNTFSRSGK